MINVVFISRHIYTYLNRRVKQIAKEKGLDDPCYLTKEVHVWPDYHGNRSPIADPNLRGMVSMCVQLNIFSYYCNL